MKRMVDLTITKANETPQYVEQRRGQIQTLWTQDSMKAHNIGVLTQWDFYKEQPLTK